MMVLKRHNLCWKSLVGLQKNIVSELMLLLRSHIQAQRKLTTEIKYKNVVAFTVAHLR